MGYASSTQTNGQTPPNSSYLPALGSITSLVSAASNPLSAGASIIGGITKVFGGSDRSSKIAPEKALQQQLYNGAVIGDITYARKLYWQTGIAGPPTGGYNENKPFASALWNQLKTTNPKVYNAALAQGPYTEQQGVDMKITAPPVADPAYAPAGSGIGGLNLSSITGGSSTPLLLAAAAAAFFFSRK
jgi:hypothetical protein